ncbi:MAG TPA: hypothetical protein VK889_04405 [Solirubrobacterales bacterium]|nr:hypothetical protein [Solirubrobacterales bacterium]
MACVAGAMALVALGCGAEERVNEPRPQVATRVSVTIGGDSLVVAPKAVAVGPERNQQIPQNENESQPPIKTDAPQAVVFVVANQTDEDTRLLIRGPKDVGSGPMVANSPGSFQTDLPPGSYTVSAGSSSDRIIIGPYRASSENDVLLP